MRCVSMIAVLLVVVAAGCGGKPAPTPPPPVSELRLGLRCENGFAGPEVFLRGQPLCVTVSIVDNRFHMKSRAAIEKRELSGEKPVRIDAGQGLWYRGLELFMSKRQGPALSEKDEVMILPPSAWPGFISAKELKRQEKTKGRLIRDDVLMVTYRVPADVTNGLVEGRYIIRAMWHGQATADGQSQDERLGAPRVELSLTSPASSQDRAAVALSNAAYYGVDQEDWRKSLLWALRTEKERPELGSWQCYWLAGTACESLGRVRSAIRYYRKYVEVNWRADQKDMPIIAIKNKIRSLEDGLRNDRGQQAP